jgi:hypothetical protein
VTYLFLVTRAENNPVDRIRPLFESLIAEFGKPGATFNVKQQLVEADYAYISWTAKTADNVYELATDTFVVREGKIVAQSFTAKIMPKVRKTRLEGEPT